MLKNNYITKKEYNYLAENLENPPIPLFYGLPKIHKIFDLFSPLRPIVSDFSPAHAICQNMLILS